LADPLSSAGPDHGRGASRGAARSALRAEALGARLPPLVVAAERVASTVMQGIHGRRRAGVGDAFWQFRAFVAGDPPSRIDWRQSAKSDRLFIRETEWEAAQTVLLWRDPATTLRWRSTLARDEKRARAELLLLALSALLLRGGEQVQLLGAPATPRPFAGRAVMPSLAAALERADAAPEPEAAPRHARAVLFSDFLCPLAEVHRMVGGLALRGIRGHLLQVLDPAEETLPYAGRIRFEGLGEAAGAPALVPRVEGVRELYAERLAQHRAGLAAIAAAAGWRFATHRSDNPPEAALLALFQALSQT
jgi:uncharacterized protein (DUF58 family)